MSRPQQTIIEPSKGWRAVDWKEVLDYRDLFYFLIKRDVTVAYKQTILGFGWAILRPVFSMIVFSVIFGKLAKVPSDGVPYPVFSYAALLPWQYFSSAMSSSTSSLIGNAKMLQKVYFPRLVIPMTPVFAGLVNFAIASSILGLLMLWYGIAPTLSIVFIPYLILLMMLTAAGIGMWLSSLAIQYRDVRYAMGFATQLMMYAAPVVWPASLITENFPEWGDTIRIVYGLYPMAGVIEGFRSALLGTHSMPWDLIGMGTLSAVALAISGSYYFRRMERIFADVA